MAVHPFLIYTYYNLQNIITENRDNRNKNNRNKNNRNKNNGNSNIKI